MYRSLISLMPKAVPLDPDAQAFLTAAGITDATITSAINTLVVDLKSLGIWSKMKAIYPFVGGSASSHKYNLKDPQNTNAAFRLSFSGGWTHSSTGALPNGTNAFADTFFNPVTQGLAYNNNHLGYYSRTQAATAISFYEMGSGDQANGGTSLFARRNNNTAVYDSGTAGSNRLLYSNSDGRGFFFGTSITSNIGYALRNGVQQAIKNPLSVITMKNFNYYLGGFNEANTVTYFSNKECAFGSIGEGLTLTEAQNYYTAVQAFQTTLNRQV